MNNTDKIVAMLPTYNESANIKFLIEELLKIDDRIEIVVVDDNSPDGTWKIVEQMKADNPKIHLVHRKNEKGRGSAGIAGFLHSLEIGADYIIEMDADFSHNPKYIKDFINRINGYDVIIGSRLVKGGGEQGRNFIRTLITISANFYIRLILGLPIKDCTSGYKMFKRNVLEQINLKKMKSNGPAIVQEVLYACSKKGFKFIECPILFEERRAGQSTFNIKIMIQGLFSVIKFRLGLN